MGKGCVGVVEERKEELGTVSLAATGFFKEHHYPGPFGHSRKPDPGCQA